MNARRCSACGVRARPEASFCGSCGEPLPLFEPDPLPPREEPPPRCRHVPLPDLWPRLQPAVLLFILLLATNAIFAIVHRDEAKVALRLEAAVTVVDALIILAFVLWDRRLLRSALNPLRALRLRTLGLSTLALSSMVVFAAVYFGILRGIGLPSVRYLEDFREASWPLWSAFVLISVCPGVFEELAFRGVILERLDRVLRPGEALFVQAAMFSVLHMSPVIFPSHFVLGLILGLLRRWTGSLGPGMAVHAVFNALVLLQETHAGG